MRHQLVMHSVLLLLLNCSAAIAATAAAATALSSRPSSGMEDWVDRWYGGSVQRRTVAVAMALA